MKKELKTKLYKNALIGEKLYKLDKVERQKIVIELLQNTSERDLSEEIGIPRSTLNDWRTLRQDNTGKNIHVSFSAMYLKLKSLSPDEITDWGRLEQIKDVIDNLLRSKK